MAKSTTTEIVRDPYSIVTDSGESVNTRKANPNRVLKIHGHKIRVRDIPITSATLSCGHAVRGIAFAPGNIVYCDLHGEGNLIQSTVVSVLQ